MDTMAHADTTCAERQRLATIVGGTLRQTWWLGLGVLAVIGEQTARAAGALVQKGREFEPTIVNPVRNTTAGIANVARPATRLNRASEALRGVRIPAAFRGAPTKEEFEQLAEEVRSLRERVAKHDDGREDEN